MEKIFKQVSINKGLPFVAELYTDKIFMNFFERLESSRNTLTKLLSIFPALEYVQYRTNKKLYSLDYSYLYASKENFLNALEGKKREVARFVTEYGTQGSIPQRAFMILSFIHDYQLVPRGKKLRIIEIGCAAGSLGKVFMNYHELINHPDFDHMFWIIDKTKLPRSFNTEYIGFDVKIPPHELLPYFVWDKEKRQKVRLFVENTKHLSIETREENAFHYLDTYCPHDDIETVILTSFMFYQIPKKLEFIKKINHYGFHWIDISRNRNDIPHLVGYKNGYCYLSLNGLPKRQVLDGSDDCPNWTDF